MDAAEQIAKAIKQMAKKRLNPIVVALDGGSGAGKTTLAHAVQRLVNSTIVRLDDFYTTAVPESQWLERSVEQRLSEVFDWACACRKRIAWSCRRCRAVDMEDTPSTKTQR